MSLQRDTAGGAPERTNWVEHESFQGERMLVNAPRTSATQSPCMPNLHPYYDIRYGHINQPYLPAVYQYCPPYYGGPPHLMPFPNQGNLDMNQSQPSGMFFPNMPVWPTDNRAAAPMSVPRHKSAGSIEESTTKETVLAVSENCNDTTGKSSDVELSATSTAQPPEVITGLTLIASENNTETEADPCSASHFTKQPHFAGLRHYLSTGMHLPSLKKEKKDVIRRQVKSNRYRVTSNQLEYRHNPLDSKWVKYLETGDDRRQALIRMHELWGHGRREMLTTKLKEQYFWHSIREDVESMLNDCHTCQMEWRGLLKVTDTLTQFKVGSKVWSLIGIDMIGSLSATAKGNKYILVLICYFSKWVEAVPLESKDSVTVAQAILDIYYRNGAPSRIITDNGGEFMNSVHAEINKVLGISHSNTAPYNPRANEMTERANQEIQRHLNLTVAARPGDCMGHPSTGSIDGYTNPPNSCHQVHAT